MKGKKKDDEVVWRSPLFQIEGMSGFAQVEMIFDPVLALNIICPGGSVRSIPVDDFIHAWKICEVIVRLKEIDMDVISKMVHGEPLPEKIVECMNSVKVSEIPDMAVIIAAFGCPDDVSERVLQGVIPWNHNLGIILGDIPVTA
ncbi:MAG: hypothetical protein WC938_01425 [Candidatus Paceibacterota bacterium]